MTGLPAPCSTTDELLVAVHTELVGLRQDLVAARTAGESVPPIPGEPVELLEPVLATSARARRRPVA